MILELLALPIVAGLGLSSSSATAEGESTATTYAGRVDPTAFRKVALERKKLGITVAPASVRLITPGVDKFSIYPLLGPPHFGEGITRQWNYVLFFPVAPGSAERVRCRMQIRFEKLRGNYSVTVREVIWQEQSCADRVAAAG